jgi:hypothetical protein
MKHIVAPPTIAKIETVSSRSEVGAGVAGVGDRQD